MKANNKMSKITNLVVIVFFSLSIVSCSKEFLDVKVQGGETTTSNPNLAQDLVTGVYSSLLQGDSWGNGDVHGFAFLSATSIASDDADKGSYAADQATTAGQFDNFTLTSTNPFCGTLWSGHYNSIGAANQALKALAPAPLPMATKKILVGEVKFLRGYFYFNLVRFFGGVPLVLQVPKDAHDANTNPVYQTRTAATVVYDSIIRDLHYAIANLPSKAQAGTGHATKGAAQSLLAKVYLYLAQWDSVKALTNQVITSGQYQLVQDYSLQFKQAGNNCSESIFEIETGKFNNSNFGIANWTVSQGPRVGGMGGWNDLGWGFNNPSTALINTYETGDLRKNATIIFIDNSGLHKGTVLWDGFRIPSSDSVQNLYYNYKAYTSSVVPSKETYATPGDKDRPKNIPVLRYADVLLMNAEAALHTGGDAATPVNLVRVRAGLLPKGSVTLADLKQERHVELAMEEDRFWDLVRWGDAASVLGSKGFVAGTHELLPIPATQILLSNGKLTQNPGY
ncbi:MAG: RagB/SusD family nutrient uptake outer membrane protein [Bacteroidetes bacterium]|nr:RagB/SusD family nutrient uptake outer membrane protein [Bacteroidota bacterium]